MFHIQQGELFFGFSISNDGIWSGKEFEDQSIKVVFLYFHVLRQEVF
jgi:hypothetical protein